MPGAPTPRSWTFCLQTVGPFIPAAWPRGPSARFGGRSGLMQTGCSPRASRVNAHPQREGEGPAGGQATPQPPSPRSLFRHRRGLPILTHGPCLRTSGAVITSPFLVEKGPRKSPRGPSARELQQLHDNRAAPREPRPVGHTHATRRRSCRPFKQVAPDSQPGDSPPLCSPDHGQERRVCGNRGRRSCKRWCSPCCSTSSFLRRVTALSLLLMVGWAPPEKAPWGLDTFGCYRF